MKLTVDFDRICGKIKPFNGFNNAARQTGYGPLLPAFRELHPTFVRLHDTCGKYGGAHYVDVPNIFPDFTADPNDPANYDFTLTDCYIEPLIECGAEVFYRLGVTIEHEPKKYRIHAPSDPEKWADICEHIVRHYNCGWADGHHWNIRYWEIWNEPDGLAPDVEPYGPPNWLGTAQEYYELYRVTANHIKSCYPDLFIGGYSSCYILGKFQNGRWESGDTSYFTGFLDYITAPKTKAPLDFFTWHGYLGTGNIDKIIRESEFVDEMLNRYGFTDIPRIDAEWNCMVCDVDTPDYRTQYYINLRNEKGASHVAGALYLMQRCKVDLAMYYDAQLWCEYGGLFHVPSLQPSKAFYAFRQFDELYRLGNWCASEQGSGVYTLAAAGAYDMFCAANITAHEIEIEPAIYHAHGTTATVLLTDRLHDYEPVLSIPLSELVRYTLPPYSFISVIIR